MSAETIKAIDDAIKANDTEHIILDNIKITEISPELKKKLDSLEKVSILWLNNCNLKTLANIPQIKDLLRLKLMGNNFPASELKHIASLEDLESLYLSNNHSNIKSMDDLKVLSHLALVQLDFSGTDLAKQDDYRNKIFALFTDLKILDNKNEEGNEVEYDDPATCGDGIVVEKENMLADNVKNNLSCSFHDGYFVYPSRQNEAQVNKFSTTAGIPKVKKESKKSIDSNLIMSGLHGSLDIKEIANSKNHYNNDNLVNSVHLQPNQRNNELI